MKLIRIKEVMNRTGLARSTVYKYISENNFPKPIKLGSRAVAWVESEIEGWINDVIHERDRGQPEPNT
ncbi:AlpA family transcriptional regulator [Marinobacter vinifirmus]|uniref:AlpA family transcriptional regulator n=1 Tax=Marinobacter vinifirmus TaxID=355591 RepID=A0A7Z1DW08_9GAMM|nr:MULTISPECIES: AlpA family transcriptional regulator [Marinobacter]OZC35912.1 AlpA family transcriptional regulator [Marinobacter vinifirmus]RUT77587.1 AlpA family transcriptional regulator [Marinobacter sp. NP-6]